MTVYTIPSDANPSWANTEQTRISLDVEFAFLGGERVRFTADPTDAAAEYAAEIFNRAAAGEFGPVADFVPQSRPPEADWRGFLQAMRTTTVFAALRGQARADVAANALATELRTALGEAALGMVEADTIQALVDELLPSLTPQQVAEIQAGIVAFGAPLTIESVDS